MSLSNKFNVAISSDFLTSYSLIPKQEQKKVSEFINKFRNNPTSSGINYENIINASDKNMKSVRIDQDYRGIIYQPKEGNIYLLLWVDKHDKAYQWATRRKCQVNEITGSIQVYESVNEIVINKTPESNLVTKLFKELNEENFISIGLPLELLPLVREVSTEEEFYNLNNKIPTEPYEALNYYINGFTIEEIISELFTDHEIKINSDDYLKALEVDGTKQIFVKLNELSDDEFEAILNAPLDKWRVFLHKSQRKLVQSDFNGPVRVLGGAGTGKTVVAIHRANWLAKNIFNGKNDKILITTFTVNLAEDIKENLKKVADVETLKRIEVINLDRWVGEFLKKQNYEYRIAYNDEIDAIFDTVVATDTQGLNFQLGFYKEEWNKVVLNQNIGKKEEYIAASRTGRGVKLSRKQRIEVWNIFQKFIDEMSDLNVRDIGLAMRDARTILSLKKNILPYKAIIVDEAQDLSSQSFMLIREMIEENKNDIFIVGDTHQRIYKNNASLGKCGINIRGRGRSTILKINYRTTEEIRRWAFNLLKNLKFDDMDEGEDEGKGYKSLFNGPAPIIKEFNSINLEIDFILSKINKIKTDDDSLRNTCIVLKTNALVGEYKELLQKKGLNVYEVKRSAPDDRTYKGIRIATMHRVKGLEFENVFICGANEGVIPQDHIVKGEEDQTIIREFEKAERSLLYVAATRAKKLLYITTSGKISRFLI